MSALDEFMVHTATVRTLTGSGGMGSVYGAPIEVACFVDDKRRLVRAAVASQVVSESSLYDVDVAHAALYPPGSEVDLPSGRTSTVIAAAVHTSGDLDLPDHIEVALT